MTRKEEEENREEPMSWWRRCPLPPSAVIPGSSFRKSQVPCALEAAWELLGLTGLSESLRETCSRTSPAGEERGVEELP